MTPEERKKTRLAKLNAVIAEAKAKKRRLLGAEASNRRKLENRRKVLAGAAVLYEAEGNAEFRASLWRLLGRFLTRPDERALFGFEPQLVVNHPAGESEENHGGEDAEKLERETESA